MTENLIAHPDVIVPLDVHIQNRQKYLENYRKITKGSDRLMLFAGDQKAEHLTGRNIHQRPLAEAVRLCNAV